MTNVLLTTEFANVTKVALTNELDVLKIKHQNCQAQVSLYGGQVLSYQPRFSSNNNLSKKSGNYPDNYSIEKESNQGEVFWLSKNSEYTKGKAIRGGIPLCWPWFGANDQAIGKIPSTNHGFAREVNWQIENIEANENEVTVVLIFQGEKQHELWPNAFILRQTLIFGKTFKQSLAMTNLSNEGAQYSGALHSYFCVSNPKNITIDALTGCEFYDKLTTKTKMQKNSVSCIGPIDREYHLKSKESLTQGIQKDNERSSVGQSRTAIICDQGWQRQIEIISTGCSQWVLWNPGVELANNMADIHDKGEQEFVCLEAANSKWQSLPANKTITISQEIKVSEL